VSFLAIIVVFLLSPQVLVAGIQRNWYGSGVVITPDGYLLTNHHVVEEADILYVYFLEGQRFRAKIIATLPEKDLAILKIQGQNFPFIPLELTREVKIGERVISIGCPVGLMGTVSEGRITGLDRDLEIEGRKLEDLYQTDVGIAPGSSGGPLIDVYGKVIGINVAVKAVQGIPLTQFGFAIPISNVADWLISTVPKLPVSSDSELEPLAISQIAEKCRPATVLIIASVEVPLASLLPKAIDGYTVGMPFTSKKQKPEIPPLELILPPVEIPGFDEPSPLEFTLPGEHLKSIYERFGKEPIEWAGVNGEANQLEAEFNVTIALFSDHSEASAAARHVLGSDMEGLQVINRGTLRVLNVPFDTVVGFGVGKGWVEELCPIGKLDMDASSYMPAAVRIPKCSVWQIGALLRITGVGIFDFNNHYNLVCAVSLRWSSYWQDPCSLPPSPDCTRTFSYEEFYEADYYWEGECVYRWVKKGAIIRSVEPVVRTEEKGLWERTEALMCLDQLSVEFDKVLKAAIETLVAGLGG